MKQFLQFLKQFFSDIRGDESANNGEKPITNQQLINIVVDVYKKRFKEETIDDTMVFPTCFRIYLHSLDFSARQAAFNLLARSMANKFNAYNRSEMHKYKYNKPHAKHWLFQFIEFKEGALVEDVDSVKMGDVHIISTLYSQDFSKNRDNIGNEKGITVTKTTKNSTNPQQGIDINLNAFLGMDMLDGNRFRIRINENYEEITTIPRSEEEPESSDTLAYLICDKNFVAGAKIGNKYIINTNTIDVSGKDDTRTSLNIAKVNYPLPNPILQIKNENSKFLLAAFGKVRLNQKLVPQSKGGDLYWVELSDNSKMLLNDEVSIEFKRVK